MEPHERIRQLRKALKINQEEFAQQINMSRSNLGNIETGRIGLTDRVISDICRTFHVNREWLERGYGSQFENEEALLDREIDRLFSQLNADSKKFVRGYMDRLLEEQK